MEDKIDLANILKEGEKSKEIVELYLKKIYERSKEDIEWFKPESIHLTDLIAECDREVVLSKLSPREPLLQSALYMADGRSKHLIELTDKHEFRVEWGGIRASIDEYDEKNKTIIEKKTTFKLPSAPRDIHIKQVLYGALILRELGYEVEKGVIIYILRTMEDIPKEFVLDLKKYTDVDWEAMKKDILKKYNELKQRIKDKTLPPRQISYYCLYCNYSDLCFTREEIF